MLKTFVFFWFFIPLMNAIPFKEAEASINLKASFPGQNPVKRIADCPIGYNEATQCESYKASGYCAPSHQFYSYIIGYCKLTCGECKAAPVPYLTPEKITFNTGDCLAASNLNRTTKHGVPSLQWDPTLASGSADWALHLAVINGFAHSVASGYGENLYYAGSSPAGSLASCTDAVKSWYGEVVDYDFDNPGNSINGKKIGHFTQVVWKATTKVGVGIAAVTRDGWTYTYVVARYTPAGNINMPGKYAENVLNEVSKK